MGAQSRSVLFVCYANVCRSPLAEGVFRHLVAEARSGPEWIVDSAGTSAMEGSPPHPLSQAAAADHGITLTGTARQLVRTDLSRFDHVVVMDRQNLSTLRRLAAPSAFGSLANYKAEIQLLRALANPRARGADLDVPDPIGRGPDRYAAVYAMILAGCEALLRTG